MKVVTSLPSSFLVNSKGPLRKKCGSDTNREASILVFGRELEIQMALAKRSFLNFRADAFKLTLCDFDLT